MAGVDLAAQAILGNVQTGWFSPNVPIAPMAPKDQAWGRRFDGPQSINLNVQPKAADGEGPTYQTLHKMVQNCDILSIALYSMLERISKYNGRVLDVGGDKRKPSKQAQAIQEWAKFPDGVTPFATWAQTFGYDMAVTDNATVYIDREGGGVPRARVIDGQSIAVRVNEKYEPAMIQQIIKGTAAHNYGLDSTRNFSLDSMVWCPKHRRANKVYGYSYVEQIRTTVTLALQRTSRQLDYFTSGNVPAMLLEAPATWTPNMVQEANQQWRDILAGVSGKDEVQIMPNGMKPHIFERDVVKNDFDEWLARVICFQFSIPPTPLVRETNRATAEASQEASVREGHAAQLRWASDSITKVIRAAFGPQFYWEWDTDAKPDAATTVDLVKAGALKRSALIRVGFDPEEIADEPESVATGNVTQDAKGEKAPAKRNPGKEEKPAPRSVKNADIEPSSLADLLKSHLDDLLEESQKSAVLAFEGESWAMERKPSKGFVLRAAAILHDAAIQGADEAMMQTPKVPETAESYEKPALKFARDQAAAMVGMKWDGQNLVVNPDTKWQISDVVRTAIRNSVALAIEEGWTPHQLAEHLSEEYAFSPARALTIARDQIATAQEAGSFAYFEAAGVTGKFWSALDACPVCTANAAQGVIPLKQAFQSGHIHGPAHPNDRCRIVPAELPMVKGEA